MAALLPVSGLLVDRFGAKVVYGSGIAAYGGVAVFPAFALFNIRSVTAYAIAMVVVFGVIHAWFYGAQAPCMPRCFLPGSATPACRRCTSCPAYTPRA